MKSRPCAALVVSLVIATGGAISSAWGYEDGSPGQAAVKGTITFSGMPPPPRLFDLAKFPQPTYCGQVERDAAGHRVVREVTVHDGRLQDVVVAITDITTGKPFHFNGTRVTIYLCRMLVQGGPSSVVGVVVNGSDIQVYNNDADPTDPKSLDGVLHNPHAYEVHGLISYGGFNKPLPTKGQTLKQPVTLKWDGSVMKLECDQHNYEYAWFYPVTNPYYAIVGPEGTFEIEQVPAGQYTLVAWHPILGMLEKMISVGATSTVTVEFEFSESMTSN